MFSKSNKLIALSTLGFSTIVILFALWLDVIELKGRFDEDVVNVKLIFSQRIASIESVLISFTSLLDVSEEIPDAELNVYSQQILAEYPYIDAVFKMQRVSHDGVELFEKNMNQRGFINLKIKSLEESNDLNVKHRQFFPISFIEPMTPINAGLLGLNLYSSDKYFDSINSAIREGKTVASKIYDVISPEKSEILLFKAFYSGRYVPNSEAQRVASVIGLVALKINVKEFFAYTSLSEFSLESELINATALMLNKPQKRTSTFSATNIESVQLIKKYQQFYQLKLIRPIELSSINGSRLLVIWFAVIFLMGIIFWLLGKRKFAENALKSSENRFTRIAHAAPVGIFQTDVNGLCTFINKGYEKIAEIKESDALGEGWVNCIYPADKKMVFEGWALSVKENSPFIMDYRMLMPDDRVIWVHCESTAERNDAGDIISYLGTIQDITNQKKSADKILYQAHYDNLTSLPNRFLTLDRLSVLIAEADRHNEKVALLFIDLDEFKKVNDSLGHEAGDSLLKEAASRLQSVVRAGDTVGRIGGDEFLMIIGDMQASLEANLIADKIIEAFSPSYKLNDKDLFITASIGISLYPDDSHSASNLLRNADLAMYHAKQMGRNAYAFFTEELNEVNSRRLDLETQMRGALGRKEFNVVFQPKVNLQNGAIMGAEALLRWHNEYLGHVSPDEFIPIAEQMDLIHEIGDFVLQKALLMTAQWQSKFCPDFKIAVNLSPKQFRNKNLIENIKQAQKASGVAINSLELEITEGLLLNKYVGIKEALSDLTESGIHLSMDDFGTGYSSLSYLRTYPFSVLKIDRSFVSDMIIDPADCELVYATIAMSHGLNLKVVAEGIETNEQCKLLKQHGCDYGQGYLFSKPVSAQAMGRLLKQKTIYFV